MGFRATVSASRSVRCLCIAVVVSAVPSVAGEEPPSVCAAGASAQFNTEEGWERLLGCVRTGNTAWLDAALRAQRGRLDGGGPGELAMAVGDALERNPSGVLRLLNRGYSSAAAVCGCEGHEDLLGPDFDLAMATIHRRTQAVTSVQAEDIKAQQRRCLKELGRLEQLARQHERDWFIR